MFNTLTFDNKIVDNKAENDGSPHVLVKAWDELALVVAAFDEALFEEFVGE